MKNIRIDLIYFFQQPISFHKIVFHDVFSKNSISVDFLYIEEIIYHKSIVLLFLWATSRINKPMSFHTIIVNLCPIKRIIWK